jgi:hypothetical protein
MYTYLLNNNEWYSDYGIVAIVQSETPIDWPDMRKRFAAALSGMRFIETRKDGSTYELWFPPDRIYAEIFAQLGVTVLTYEETGFDVRHALNDDFNDISGEWRVLPE